MRRRAYAPAMADDPKSFFLSPEIHRYVVDHGIPPDPIQCALTEETANLGGISMMQISPEQGAFMTMLTQLVGARSAVEVGTFTGYSSTAMALAQPDGGRITCCDVSREWTDIARRAWADAGVEDRIELRLGGDDELLAAARAHEPYVTGETLATRVEYADNGTGEAATIEGRPLRIAVTRA